MRWVDVPFEIDGDTMHTQRTEWPQNCACCGGAADGRTEGIDGTLEMSRGPGGVESSFNVSFPVPFCGECGGHAGVVLPIQFSAGVAAFLIWVLIGWILFLADMAYDVMGMVLFLGSAVLLAALAYWVSRRLIDVLSEAKMKESCVKAGFAVDVEPHDGNWRIEFHRDDYAEAFAAHNGLVMLSPRT
jgi:hypothetical protein